VNKKTIITISIIVGIILLGIVTFLIINHNNELEEKIDRLEKEKQDKEKIVIPDVTDYTEEKPIEIETIDEIKEYNYSIRNIDTNYYKDEFKKLKEILTQETIDNEKYAEYIARLFIIDLYTLNTKTNKYDVGSIKYFYDDKKEIFKNKVIDTLYASVKDNTYGDRKQELPEVKSIKTISVKETTYQIDGNTVNGYEIKLKWTYVTDMGYDTEGTVIVVQQNDSKWAVVDFQNKI